MVADFDSQRVESLEDLGRVAIFSMVFLGHGGLLITSESWCHEDANGEALQLACGDKQSPGMSSCISSAVSETVALLSTSLHAPLEWSQNHCHLYLLLELLQPGKGQEEKKHT